MKKFIISIVALLTLVGNVAAQENNYDKAIAERRQYFIFGPKAGICSPYQNAITNTTDIKALLNGVNTGVQMGGFLRGMLPIKRTNIVLYAQLDATYAMDFYYGGGSSAMSGVLNFPIMVGGGYRFSNGIFLRGGWGGTWTANLFSTANTTYKGVDNDYQSEVASMINRDPWGWVADIGVDYKRWTIDLRYMNQFRSRDYTRIVDEVRYISFGLSVGYLF